VLCDNELIEIDSLTCLAGFYTNCALMIILCLLLQSHRNVYLVQVTLLYLPFLQANISRICPFPCGEEQPKKFILFYFASVLFQLII
jgi:hypothetical protein